ncbi:hypothetical protein KIW84_044712 [Lathyrus oleraceus]|uniref:Auxin response factor domain-containing protein n=1 Tax=Pisum sativum TaxID=3888 RepID=A0A9D5AW92_PEA|nr:hypothetical protein KIW84_044712 [Pisum sativum]
MENPNYLSSKILCIVMGIELKAKVDTDEIFALVTLFPLSKQQEIILENNHAIQSPSELYSFSQILTSSEISTLGGLYIPKEHAERCFPPLDMTLEPPMHDLVEKDLHGNDGENGEFGIGIRRDMKQHINVCCTSSSQQSSQNMQLPSLVAALHAVCIGTLFHVQYYPWYGTIVGNEDIDPINWPASDWRSLRVQWDSIPNIFTHLERVCPWWIEPLKDSKIKGIHVLPLPKKIDEYDSLLHGLSDFGLKG